LLEYQIFLQHCSLPLKFQQNYFDDPKLFSDLYPAKFYMSVVLFMHPIHQNQFEVWNKRNSTKVCYKALFSGKRLLWFARFDYVCFWHGATGSALFCVRKVATLLLLVRQDLSRQAAALLLNRVKAILR